jgi:hypothetical protein
VPQATLRPRPDKRLAGGQALDGGNGLQHVVEPVANPLDIHQITGTGHAAGFIASF